MSQIAQTQEIIKQNKWGFGVKARTRKAAKAELQELQERLTRLFPNGRP